MLLILAWRVLWLCLKTMRRSTPVLSWSLVWKSLLAFSTCTTSEKVNFSRILPTVLLLSFYLQGHSTLQPSQDSSTLLTWMAETNSQRTVNAAATTPRKSKGRIASQVQDGGKGQGRTVGLCRNVLGMRGVSENKPCPVFCCLSILIGLCLPP